MFNLWTRYLHYFSSLLIFLALIALPASCKPELQEGFDLAKFYEAWKEYISYPSSENAIRVYELLPDTGHVTQYIDFTKEYEDITWEVYESLDMLERQVYTSDRKAVQLAFRLLTTFGDAAFSEELDIILGTLIRINPKLFLEELYTHRNLVSRLDALVGNFGPEYYGPDKAVRLETSLRIKALKQVTDPKLVEVRDECIVLLESFHHNSKED